MKEIERKATELCVVMLGWALIVGLAIEALWRKYGVKLIFSTGFGPVPVNQGVSLILAMVILVIGTGIVFYLDHKSKGLSGK